MSNFIKILRGTVRPILSYGFAAIFLYLVVLAFKQFATEQIAQTLITSFIGVAGVIFGLWFQSRNQSQLPPS